MRRLRADETRGAAFPVLELSGSSSVLELVLAELWDVGCLGTEEVSEAPVVRAYFARGVELEELVAEIQKAHPGVTCRLAAPVPARDWLRQFKERLRGFALGDSFFVLPTWKDAPQTPRTILRIDPEQAFGTGVHDTTRLSAELLERWVRAGNTVLDIGTGTGILAMVALACGAGSVLALEPDAAALDCARENLRRNGFQDKVRLEPRRFDAPVEPVEPVADIAVANVQTAVLERGLPRLRAGVVILSGILTEEASAFLSGLDARYRLCESWSAGEWCALVLVA